MLGESDDAAVAYFDVACFLCIVRTIDSSENTPKPDIFNPLINPISGIKILNDCDKEVLSASTEIVK